MTLLDRIFGWLLVVGGLLHAGGSWHAFHDDPPRLVCALSGSLAALLVAALNLLRVGRPDDRPLAWLSLAASIAWVAVALGFGVAIGHPADPRAVIHAVNAAVLAALSARTLLRASQAVARLTIVGGIRDAPAVRPDASAGPQLHLHPAATHNLAARVTMQTTPPLQGATHEAFYAGRSPNNALWRAQASGGRAIRR